MEKVFVRAYRVSLSGKIFNLLESYGQDYLVKVKQKKLENTGCLSTGLLQNLPELSEADIKIKKGGIYE